MEDNRLKKAFTPLMDAIERINSNPELKKIQDDGYEFILEDRLAKIRAINEQYDLEHNAYIAFSGGKDSTVLHYLIDLALPNNNIPRVYLNTGIEYQEIRKFVQELAKNDNRIIVLNSGVNIKKMLQKEGYPFKSKVFSNVVEMYNRLGKVKTIRAFLGEVETKNGNIKKGQFRCPNDLKYIFEQDNKLNFKISHLCCYKLKKEPAKKWAQENNKTITLTGIRKEEGGARLATNCIIADKDNNLSRFNPLLVVNEEWENWFIKHNNIQLCKLYYPPYNFERTGCKGCPFDLHLQKDLDTMERLLPNEKKQCEILWEPVYDEYRRIGYRLRKKKDYEQISIFDLLED